MAHRVRVKRLQLTKLRKNYNAEEYNLPTEKSAVHATNRDKRTVMTCGPSDMAVKERNSTETNSESKETIISKEKENEKDNEEEQEDEEEEKPKEEKEEEGDNSDDKNTEEDTKEVSEENVKEHDEDKDEEEEDDEEEDDEEEDDEEEDDEEKDDEEDEEEEEEEKEEDENEEIKADEDEKIKEENDENECEQKSNPTSIEKHAEKSNHLSANDTRTLNYLKHYFETQGTIEIKDLITMINLLGAKGNTTLEAVANATDYFNNLGQFDSIERAVLFQFMVAELFHYGRTLPFIQQKEMIRIVKKKLLRRKTTKLCPDK